MSASQNVVRFLYVQMYMFAIALLVFPEQFLKFYKSNTPLTPESKHLMMWWGSSLLTAGLLLSAVAQCGEFACRKALQYAMVQPMVQMWIAVNVQANFAPSDSVIFTICHCGLNLCLSLYAVYGVPCKPAPVQKLQSPIVKYMLRYFYVMLLFFGIGPMLFQDEFAVLYETKKPMTAQDKHIMWWWGSQALGISLMLMGVAQCGYAAGKKSLQYTMVGSMVNIYLGLTVMPEFTNGWKAAAGHNMLNVGLAIVACYVVKPTACKAD